jgi:hypothetical protein
VTYFDSSDASQTTASEVSLGSGHEIASRFIAEAVDGGVLQAGREGAQDHLPSSFPTLTPCVVAEAEQSFVRNLEVAAKSCQRAR